MSFFRRLAAVTFLLYILPACVFLPDGPGDRPGGSPEPVSLSWPGDVPSPDTARPGFPSTRPGKPERITAVQVLLFDCSTMKDVESRIAVLKRAGFDTLIFRVFHNEGDRFYEFSERNSDRGVYFKTDHAPVVDDILGEIAAISHRKGMKIFAWMTTRYADYGVEDRPGWQAAGYDLKRGVITRAKGLNLFNGEVRDHLKALYRDLARYDIDGILFQDDLVFRHTEGFSPEARRGFTDFYGRPPEPRMLYREVHVGKDGNVRVSTYGDRFWEWSRWKNRILLDVAGEIMKEVRRVRPDMLFALNLMYEAVLSPKNALAWLSQDLEEALDMEFDYFAVMAYHRQIGRELGMGGETLERTMKRLVERSLQVIGDPDRALIKVQIMDWKSEEVLPAGEVGRILGIVKGNGAGSIALVPYKSGFDFNSISPLINAPAYAELGMDGRR